MCLATTRSRFSSFRFCLMWSRCWFWQVRWGARALLRLWARRFKEDERQERGVYAASPDDGNLAFTFQRTAHFGSEAAVKAALLKAGLAFCLQSGNQSPCIWPIYVSAISAITRDWTWIS